MSMLTAQADHLREMSYTVERVKGDAVGKLSLSDSITLAMAAMDMRDAADTIDGLRRRCQEAQADNIKLRHENERLRKLLNNSLDCIDYGNCESCYCVFGGCTLRSAMRELGIEVK